MFSNIFEGKTVLVTGHTGFKGSWLCIWLKYLGAKVIGISLGIPTEPSCFRACELDLQVDDRRVDIRDFRGLSAVVREVQPDFVFHLAAQALVNTSYESPMETFSTNVIGSLELLQALRDIEKRCAVIMVTSDKVYENNEWCWGYRECDQLGGADPYSASKSMADIGIRSYIKSFFAGNEADSLRVAIGRAGNVIGGGDWAANRIIPDCIRAWSVGESVKIRNPKSTRPWQHVFEPLSGYLQLASNLYLDPQFHGEAYNFGPLTHGNHTVDKLIEEMRQIWSGGRWEDVSEDVVVLREAGLLNLNCDKAKVDLGWMPTLEFDETVELTACWYKDFYNSRNSMMQFSITQLQRYITLAQMRKISWAG
jgi:CDP-glucose 4,6-dehydratase